ncbi:Regenectin [Gryllus bimaculatus]|nr:Regenectin [Gryllus bimaculatus]
MAWAPWRWGLRKARGVGRWRWLCWVAWGARGLVRAQQCGAWRRAWRWQQRKPPATGRRSVCWSGRSEAPGAGAGEVRLDVEPSTAICGGARVDTLTLTIRGPPPPPGPGYVSVPGVGYYRIHKENRTWAEAKAICEAEGGHLLIINSEAEDKAIQQLLKQEQKLSTWIFIVFSDIEKEGSYFTIFGTHLY